MSLHIETMPDDETLQAAMYGPLVLAGRFEPVTREMTYSSYGPKSGTQINVPGIAVDPAHPEGWIEPDSGRPLTFRAVGQPQPISLVPLNQIIYERYAIYWKVNTKPA
jgi:uncharacterized protein